MKRDNRQRQEQFLAMADRYQAVIAKVCTLYATAEATFADLYQEVMVNLWQGLDSYRGDSQLSTWIYRVALNTCITLHRHNSRHNVPTTHPEYLPEQADTCESEYADVAALYTMIARLDPVEKALITLWLDEKTYDEIAIIMGMSKTNVATRLHRAKKHLSEMAPQFL